MKTGDCVHTCVFKLRVKVCTALFLTAPAMMKVVRRLVMCHMLTKPYMLLHNSQSPSRSHADYCNYSRREPIRQSDRHLCRVTEQQDNICLTLAEG